MANFYETLVALLKTDERFVAENGTLLRNKIYAEAKKMDEHLIEMLLGNPETKARFFKEVKGVKVFDKKEFAWMVSNRGFLSDDYTRFSKRIGLTTSDGKFLVLSHADAGGDVELVFPHKDCVLLGDQTEEDNKKQRDEIFYNESLARDEIDRLLDPKVFVNVKRYTKNGEEGITRFDENDNLVIKGNNLLAISSLRERYEGKIKLIYIDPPYNTGNDGFKYNDNFRHSSWLTFMRNRLLEACNLLSSNGSIWIQIDDNEFAYLKVLCDEIFSRKNFVGSVCVKMSHLSGNKMSHIEKTLPKLKEFILVYAKDKSKFRINPEYIPVTWPEAFERYKQYVLRDHDNPDDVSKWVVKPLTSVAKDNKVDIKDPKALERFCIENSKNIFRTARNNTKQFKELPKEKKFREFISATGLKKLAYKGEEVIFASDHCKLIDGKLTPMSPVGDIWLDIGINNLHKEGGVRLKNGKKPEKLLRRIIEMTTREGDIVLDFYLGTGTTCAVAHKLKRKYIGVEQLDTQMDRVLSRLCAVIKGENVGLSKDVLWKGGGSFVYCELAKQNQNFVEEIQVASNVKALKGIYERILKSGFISHKVSLDEIAEATKGHPALALDANKDFLMKILDKNLLYVNYCDIDDKEFEISNEDKEFTKSFYK